MKLWMVATILLAAAPAQAKLSDWDARTFTDAEGHTQPYRILEPMQQGGKSPVVLFFHGSGERGLDNASQLKNGVDELFTADPNRSVHNPLVIVPQCPEGKRWVEVDWHLPAHTLPATPSEPMALAMELLDAMLTRSDVDGHRVYVMGLSMGGYGTWDLLARRPHTFAAAIPMCGGADEATASRIASTPIWDFHGGADDVVYTSRSRHMVAALRAASGSPLYTEVPGVGHAVWPYAFKDPQLLPWLFSQRG